VDNFRSFRSLHILTKRESAFVEDQAMTHLARANLSLFTTPQSAEVPPLKRRKALESNHTAVCDARTAQEGQD